MFAVENPRDTEINQTRKKRGHSSRNSTRNGGRAAPLIAATLDQHPPLQLNIVQPIDFPKNKIIPIPTIFKFPA